VRINTSTGLITGVPGRAGTTHPTVSATDTTGQVGSVTFAWQINPIPCPHC
jgi:predicted transcriptional regulator